MKTLNSKPDSNVAFRNDPFTDTRKWRDELHGIRGVAIFLVVAFHIFGNGRVSGGIDIFLAITGFLAVPSLYRRACAAGGFIPLATRFGGLARRLLVPLAPVLIVIAVVGSFVIPLGFQPQMFVELRASALFSENIELVRSQLSYDAAGPQTSALQHLWSTSIQMQFHILMPFVFMLLTVPMIKAKRDPKNALIAILTVISVLSFAYAWWYQGVNQEANYFSSLSRLWQLTLPGVLGLTVPRFKLSSKTRAVMSWVGLLMILSTGFLFDGASVFPGPQALLPVGGLMLFLTAGKTYQPWGADRVVELAPITFLADISYSLYLWHWPLIIFYLNYFNKSELTVLDALIVFVISLALGTIGKKLFEDRAASANFLKNDVAAVAIALVVVLVLATAFQIRVGTTSEAKRQEAEKYTGIENAEDYPGAMAISDGLEAPPMEPIPQVDVALTQYPDVYNEHRANFNKRGTCVTGIESEDTSPYTCESGDLAAPQTVLLTGGSHVGQWWPAFKGLAEKHNWRLVFLERSGCQLGLQQDVVEPDVKIYKGCQEWNENAIDYIKTEVKPDLIVTLGTSQQFHMPEQIRESQKLAWKELEDYPLLLVRDNPFFGINPTACIKEDADISDPSTYDSCDLDRSDYGYSDEFDQDVIAEHPENSHYVDAMDILEVDGKLKAVIGNVYVWRNDGHISTLYSQTTQSFLEQEIRKFQPDLLH